jgi:response regulator RpfG family c-di-GMP phosphodiesterase
MILSPRYEVVEASDAAEALRMLETGDISLMTLDLNMPGMQGDELLRIVRRRHPNVEVVIVTGHPSIDSATEALRLGVGDYLQKPFDVVQVNAAVGRCLERLTGRTTLVEFLGDLSSAVGQQHSLASVLHRVDVDPGARRRVGDMIASLGTGQASDLTATNTFAFLEVLADAVESQSGFLRGHARRTGFYAGVVADRLCLSADQREHIRIAGFLHDIGKVGVPSELLSRDGPLTDHEREVMQRHPEIGARLVQPLGLAAEIGSAILHHHEWWDGRGYGDGLFGDQIPIEARIIGLVDAYDAMTCDRPYRRALAPHVVLSELVKYGGIQFDPALTREFIRIVETSRMDLPLLAEPAATALLTPHRTAAFELPDAAA